FSFETLTRPGSLAFSILGGLSAPILQGKRIKANYKGSLASNFEAYHNYQKAIYNGFREVNTNIIRIQNYQQIVDFKGQQVETLHEAITSANDLFRSGYASYLEVIITQKTALDAEIGLINSQKEQYISF